MTIPSQKKKVPIVSDERRDTEGDDERAVEQADAEPGGEAGDQARPSLAGGDEHPRPDRDHRGEGEVDLACDDDERQRQRDDPGQRTVDISAL